MSKSKVSKDIEALEVKIAVPTFDTYQKNHPGTHKRPDDPFFSPGHGHKKKPKPFTTHQHPKQVDLAKPGQQDQKDFGQHDHAYMHNVKTQAGGEGVAGILKRLHGAMGKGEGKYLKDLAKKHGAKTLLELAHKIHTHKLS